MKFDNSEKSEERLFFGPAALGYSAGFSPFFL
jgi:hypothetical protein